MSRLGWLAGKKRKHTWVTGVADKGWRSEISWNGIRICRLYIVGTVEHSAQHAQLVQRFTVFDWIPPQELWIIWISRQPHYDQMNWVSELLDTVALDQHTRLLSHPKIPCEVKTHSAGHAQPTSALKQPTGMVASPTNESMTLATHGREKQDTHIWEELSKVSETVQVDKGLETRPAAWHHKHRGWATWICHIFFATWILQSPTKAVQLREQNTLKKLDIWFG